MNSRRLSAGMMLAGTVLIGAPAADGAQIDEPNLVVRMYVSAAAHSPDWTVSAREATAILDAAGVDTGWIDCSPAQSTDTIPARCNQPLKSNEVAVRVIRGQPSGHLRVATLGESLLDPVRRAGTLATIYVDRVEWLARAGGVEPATMLARAMAHEIGHLLLGTTRHSRRGLMRAVWSQQELVQARPADWRFDIEDAAGLQQALDRRTLTPDAQRNAGAHFQTAWNTH